MYKFQQLRVYKLALEYVDAVYELSGRLPESERFNLRSQLERAVTSIVLNIAEGSTGQSTAEQNRFLGLALRSYLETIACFDIAERRGYLSSDVLAEATELGHQVFVKLQAFRKALETPVPGLPSRMASHDRHRHLYRNPKQEASPKEAYSMREVRSISIMDIQRYARKIAERFHPDRIILFGSHAYGNPTSDSDVDLLVVAEFEGRPVEQAYEICSSVKSPFPLDLLVRRPTDVRRRIELGDFFLREILEKGKVLYERARS